MKRQSVRRSVIFVSFLLFPITLYYFSPVLSLSGAFFGILSGSCLVFGLLFISSFFVGRGFCGCLVLPGDFRKASTYRVRTTASIQEGKIGLNMPYGFLGLAVSSSYFCCRMEKNGFKSFINFLQEFQFLRIQRYLSIQD